MSSEMNELADALRQLQPAPVDQGRMLFEAGRAAGARRARFWQSISAVTSTIAVTLAGFLVLRLDYKDADAVSSRGNRVEQPAAPAIAPVEPVIPTEDPLPEWRWRQHEVHLEGDFAADAGDGLGDDLRPFRVGDVQRALAPWIAFTNSGDQ